MVLIYCFSNIVPRLISKNNGKKKKNFGSGKLYKNSDKQEEAVKEFQKRVQLLKKEREKEIKNRKFNHEKSHNINKNFSKTKDDETQKKSLFKDEVPDTDSSDIKEILKEQKELEVLDLEDISNPLYKKENPKLDWNFESDLKKAIVMKEILDKPVFLRR